MRFVEENEPKVRLPDLPHIPEEMLDLYYKKEAEGKLKNDDYFYIKKYDL